MNIKALSYREVNKHYPHWLQSKVYKWLQQKQLKYLDKVFYFEGKIYDFNNRWSQRYSKTNRHKKWQKVTKFHSKY